MPSDVGYTFVSNVPGVMLAIGTASAMGIKKATQHISNKAKQNLTGTRKGRTPPRRYFVPGTKQPYTASGPGEYPALASGQLRGSVHWKISSDTGIVFTQVLHGAYLEDPKNRRTEAEGRRRWLKRTFDEEENMVKEIIYGAGNPSSRRWF